MVLRVCRTLAVLLACLAIFARGVALAEELYPHAEREGGPWGYIDKAGKVVIELKYDFVWPFSEGLAGVELKGKYGFIDSTGRFAIEPQFDFFRSFKNGYAAVKIGTKWGIIDRGGATIVPPIYAAASSFSEDRATVAIGPDTPPTKWKFAAVDPAGRIVIEPQYDGLGQRTARVRRSPRTAVLPAGSPTPSSAWRRARGRCSAAWSSMGSPAIRPRWSLPPARWPPRSTPCCFCPAG
jgi:hypothetical protein